MRSSILYEALPNEKLVCSYRFADLQRDGNLSLVVGTDMSGRELCSEVFIIDKTASGFKIYFAGGSGADVSSNIEDIGHNGNLEYVRYPQARLQCDNGPWFMHGRTAPIGT